LNITSGDMVDYRGQYWSVGVTGYTMFSHIQTPNQYKMNGCRLGCNVGCHMDNSVSYPASSNHSGGVNVLMADGSVRFIKDSIARATWWAIGTKAGGETVSADQF
jgi:prepilin-type processing-associated H-X9-DG protein